MTLNEQLMQAWERDRAFPFIEGRALKALIEMERRAHEDIPTCMDCGVVISNKGAKHQPLRCVRCFQAHRRAKFLKRRSSTLLSARDYLPAPASPSSNHHSAPGASHSTIVE